MESGLISAERILRSPPSRNRARYWRGQRAKHKPILQAPGSKRSGKGLKKLRMTKQNQRAGLVWLHRVSPQTIISLLPACPESFVDLKDSIGPTLCKHPIQCEF